MRGRPFAILAAFLCLLLPPVLAGPGIEFQDPIPTWGGLSVATYRIDHAGTTSYLRVEVLDTSPTSPSVAVKTTGWSSTVPEFSVVEWYDRESRVSTTNATRYFWYWIGTLDAQQKINDALATRIGDDPLTTIYRLEGGLADGHDWTYDSAGNLLRAAGDLEGSPITVARVSDPPTAPPAATVGSTEASGGVGVAALDSSGRVLFSPCYDVSKQRTEYSGVAGHYNDRARSEDCVSGRSIAGHYTRIGCFATGSTYTIHDSGFGVGTYKAGSDRYETFSAETRITGETTVFYAFYPGYGLAHGFTQGYVGLYAQDLRTAEVVGQATYHISAGGVPRLKAASWTDQAVVVEGAFPVRRATDYAVVASVFTHAQVGCVGGGSLAQAEYIQSPSQRNDPNMKFSVAFDAVRVTLSDCESPGDAGDSFAGASLISPTPLEDCPGALTSGNEDWFKFQSNGGRIYYRMLPLSGSPGMCFSFVSPAGVDKGCVPHGRNWDGTTFSFQPDMSGEWRLRVRATTPHTMPGHYTIAVDPK